MHFQLRKCSKCKKYSLKESCDTCKEKTVSVHPAKFSPDDKYMRYRILNKNN
jgi:H/ACA ribonucleoprotein complex subunit 3